MTTTQGPPAVSVPVPNMLAIFLFLNVVGCVLLAATGYVVWRSLSLSVSGAVADATVVGLLEDEPTQLFTQISPVVEFTANGQSYSTRSQNYYPWWDRFLRFSVGRAVEVRYDPANPQNAEINSVLDLWGTPVLLGLVTVIFLLGVNGFMLMRWRAGRARPAAA